MGKISKNALITGAKKATKYVSLVALATSLALAVPTTAAAYVEPQNIIGEAQTNENRTDIRFQDAQDINQYFTGFDYYGNRFVTREEIAKAIILSDQLNAYNGYLANEYSNTRKSEVLGLNMIDLYDEYLADEQYDFQVFCARNIDKKPAIDAYLHFACGSLSAEIKADLEDAVYNALVNAGVEVSNYPKIRIKGNTVYAIARANGYVQLIELNLDNVPNLQNMINNLDNRYYRDINNIAGYSNEYTDSFAYNGIDTATNESAWLSLGDDELKATLNEAINYQASVDNNFTIGVGDERFFVWEDKDLEAMRFFGFTEEEIANAIKIDATAILTDQLVK